MPRRIDIELTSALADGSYTWRAAGAREPKGVLNGEILPPGTAVGDELKVEIDQMVDGIEVLSVVKGREKSAPDLLELLPSDQPFEAVIETRAKRDRRDRDDRRDGRSRGRDGRGRDGRRRDGRDRKDRDGDRDGGRGRGREGGRQRRERPHFDPPPEVPQRPKPKRLRPGKKHRQEVLAELPEEQRPIAEVALQGMGAVRTRLSEENEKLVADGKPKMPEATVMKMAEELLPKLRTADWLDRAEAALAQMDQLDLRDLRSVVAAGSDPAVVRDESTRAVATELQEALVRKQEEELRLWLEDVDAALGVGRAIRALRLSSQPPKAGVMFPPDLARRLGEAATKSLQPEDSADRWAAVMEAAAFSPVRSLVVPTAPPNHITDELRATALRLGPLLPQIAVVIGVEVPADAPKPKPLRPQHRRDGKDGKGRQGKGGRRDGDGSRRGRDQAGDRRPEKQGDRPRKGQRDRQPEGATAAPTSEAAAPEATSEASTSEAAAPEATSEASTSEAAAPEATSEAATSEAAGPEATSDAASEATSEAPTAEAAAPEETSDAAPGDETAADPGSESADTSTDTTPTTADTSTDTTPTPADTSTDTPPTPAETSTDTTPTTADTSTDTTPTPAETTGSGSDNGADAVPVAPAEDVRPD